MFIESLQQQRETQLEEQIEACREWDERMQRGGIVAVGDISNGSQSFLVKEKSPIQYYTFLEVFGFTPDVATKVMEQARQKKEAYFNDQISISPHSPYSVSANLFDGLQAEFAEDGVFTMHNQESLDEHDMFNSAGGGFLEMIQSFGQSTEHWKATGKSSLQSVLNRLPSNRNLLLVHNTFSEQADIEAVNQFSKQVYWVTCPVANLYIEETLPDYEMLVKGGAKMCIGTDSLASNHNLSILDELHVLEKATGVGFEELIRWATLNGAEALNMNDQLGSIEVGKSPGLNLLKKIDPAMPKLTGPITVEPLLLA